MADKEGNLTDASALNVISSSDTISEVPPVTENNEVDNDPRPAGELMRLLRRSLDMTVNKCVAKETVQRLFFKNYPELAKKHRKSLEGIHKQYVEKLDLIIRDEMSVMFEEEGLEELLNELEQLSKSSDCHQTAWRPSGRPRDDVRAHVLLVKHKQRDKLQQLLRDEVAETERLHEILTAKRRHLTKTHAQCNQATQQLQQVAQDLTREDLENFVCKTNLQQNNST